MATFGALFIAPNPQLAAVAAEVAPDYPEFSVTIHEGDLSEGLAAALGSFEADFDVVISRGGTAQLLEEEFSVPVIEVGISTADLLAALLVHNPSGKKTAIVGFSNALDAIEQYVDFSDFDIDIFGISFEDELPLVLQDVVEGAYEVVLCDTFTYRRCLSTGIDAHLLSSGPESVSTALDRALFLCRQTHELRLRNRALWKLVKNQPARIAIFSSSGKLVYCNLISSRTELLSFMRGHLEGEEAGSLALRRGRQVFRLSRVHVGEDGENLIAFNVTTANAPLKESLVGIEYKNRDEVDRAYHESVFHLVGAGDELAADIAQAGKSGLPVLLEGKPGCGVSQVAALLYLSGSWGMRPYVVVDCSMLVDKSWEHLMNSHHSPLYESDQTLYLRAVHELSAKRLRELVEVVSRMGVTERNRVIISAAGPQGVGRADARALLDEHLHCHVLAIPPLSRRQSLRSTVSRYLDHLAHAVGERAPLVTDEAMELLARHPWPGNYVEFSRVLRQARAQVGEGELRAADVRSAFEREGVVRSASLGSEADAARLDLLRPLKDVERDVVRLVVKRYDGNQTKAAQTLGISRTTIWRMLRE
ncbi:sigma-54-dependent transcriptional regulator [Thermophilibacter immobilis]|uniref:PrpR N-terminal domain-containing protein n=1 Tax=Thermophilibacter immobilis TaxID=2779519 RepID=A0A7S7M9M5_9ACTN|nr:sigma-54-dependent transcriptional regulator [Thermophilibacter immobilis]QOY60997.1 PrpR N-terminal domain-containing protein [Thermophilibacter immobilis]